MQGRVTSLSLSHDQLHLLSCSRDDTLKVIDLRVSNIRQVFRYLPCVHRPCGFDWGSWACARPVGGGPSVEAPLDQGLLRCRSP